MNESSKDIQYVFTSKPTGIFSLFNSNLNVGSNYSYDDLRIIFDQDLNSLAFDKNGFAPEKAIQKYSKTKFKIGFHELLLSKIIKNKYPNSIIERQFKVGKFKIDLKVTIGNIVKFIEFDGPYHFFKTCYGEPKNIFDRKKKIEDETGIEIVNWAYWIQLCERNFDVAFGFDKKGFGALWNANCHFGDFWFDDSGNMINQINKTFDCINEDGIGYFYEENSMGRTKPEHPIIKDILNNKKSWMSLIPSGVKKDFEFWLPKQIKTN